MSSLNFKTPCFASRGGRNVPFCFTVVFAIVLHRFRSRSIRYICRCFNAVSSRNFSCRKFSARVWENKSTGVHAQLKSWSKRETEDIFGMMWASLVKFNCIGIL